MMFGSREPFVYLRCGGCGSASIGSVPGDLGRHYPPDYLSFGSPHPSGRFGRLLKRARARHRLESRDPLGAILLLVAGDVPYLEWCRRAGVSRHHRILDVGSGEGHLIVGMAGAGFRDLTGVDPYLPANRSPLPGVRLIRGELGDLDERFDLVMLHHSLEHMADPVDAMGHVRRLLNPGGAVIVRLPLIGGFAERTYGEHWVQWDAPRHLFVPSRRGMELAARRAGLAVESVVYDSTGLQFWGSELYRRGIPLTERHLHVPAGRGSVFTRAELRGFERRAAELNASGDGDQACFFLRAA
jgi:SAM-dependent methyltransferase